MLHVRLIAFELARFKLAHPEQTLGGFANHNLARVGNGLIRHVVDLLLNSATDLPRAGLQSLNCLKCQALALAKEPQHQVLGANIAVMKPYGFLAAILYHIHQSFRIPYHVYIYYICKNDMRLCYRQKYAIYFD